MKQNNLMAFAAGPRINGIPNGIGCLEIWFQHLKGASVDVVRGNNNTSPAYVEQEGFENF